jgi:hypothetical protein
MQRLKPVCQPEPDAFGGNRLNLDGKRKRANPMVVWTENPSSPKRSKNIQVRWVFVGLLAGVNSEVDLVTIHGQVCSRRSGRRGLAGNV